MVSNTQDNGPDDFEDEAFDEAEFSEEAFDEQAFDESEFTEADPDAEFADEDFTDEDWQEDAVSANGGKEHNLYQTGEKKGLSFNTIVIIGAVIVGGGVMAINIMNKTAEAEAKKGDSFFSMLDISGVMDRMLFGEEEVPPTPEELAAKEQQSQQEGFLSNPEVLDQHPPQPAPIAPAETDPLVSAPGENMGTPRGPEEGIPENQVVIAEMPIQPVTPITPDPEPVVAPQPTVSAEDLLKQAIANREKKQEENPAAEQAPAVVPVAPEQPSAPEVVSAQPAPAPTTAPETVPVASAPSPAQAAEAAANAEALAANTKAMEALASRIEEMTSRVQKIETDLGSVRDTKSNEYQQLEQTLSGLKQDVQTLKDRPATERVVVQEKAPEPVKKAEAPVAEEPKAEISAPSAETPKKVVKKAAPKKASPAKTATAPSRLELRAAQPGRAWISKPGDRDMQSVQVGQTVPGLGRITAITFQNGRWAVIGTQGQVRQ